MKFIIITTVLVLSHYYILAQGNSDYSNNLVSNTILKLEKDISRMNENVRRYESEITKCEKKISDSEKLIALSKEKGNAEAEQVAKNALMQSTAAKEKNIQIRDLEHRKKSKAERNLLSLKNILAKSSVDKYSFTSVALKYYGDVNILKQNGKQIKINESSVSLLEYGDIISTSPNSKVGLQFLEGRGNLILGENSKLKFNQTDSTDIIEMFEGKVKFGIQKIEEFEKEYEKILKGYRKKFEIKQPSCALTIRGTEFTLETNEDKSTEITVLEGAVEVKSADGEKIIIINTGEKGTVDKEGNISDPVKVDFSNFEIWWDDIE
jgi:hypothetical protein